MVPRPARAAPPASQAPPAERLGAGFTAYWLTQSVSLFGDGFAFIAFPLLVLQATGSVTQMGRVTATAAISLVAASLVAGPAADRLPPQAVILGCDLLRAAVNLGIALIWTAWPRLALLYVAVALSGGASAYFRAAHNVMLTRLVPRSRVARATSLYQLSAGVAFLVGPALGGAVAGAFGPVAAVAVNGCSFAAAAAGMLILRPRPRPESAPPPAGPRDQGWRAGPAYIWHEPALRRLLILTAVTMALTFGLIDLFIYYLRHDLHNSPAAVGGLIAGAAVGAIAAAAAGGPLRRRLGLAACWTGACLTAAGATAALTVITGLPALLLAGTAFTFATVLAVVCSIALRLELTPAHLTGRIAAAFASTQVVAVGAGAVSVTAAAGLLGAHTVFVAAAAALVLTGLASAVRPWPAG